jgi:hypothetical protein
LASHMRKMTHAARDLLLFPASRRSDAIILDKGPVNSAKRYFLYIIKAIPAEQITYILKIGYG